MYGWTMHPNLAKLGIHAPGYPGYPGEFLGNSGDFLKSNLRVRKQRGPKQNLKYFYCVQRNLIREDLHQDFLEIDFLVVSDRGE